MASLESCSPLFGNIETPPGHLGRDSVWSGAMGWNGPGAGARLLSASFSKQFCLSVELLPVPPPLGPSSVYL